MPNKFKLRSNEPELLDSPDIPKKLLYQNLRELDFINRVLGSNSLSLKAIEKLVVAKDKNYHIVDLGCGSGDTMIHIAKWAREKGFKVKLTGVDKNVDVIRYLDEHCKGYPEISGVAIDYRDFLLNSAPIDIIHCSLFCHHLKDEDLIDLFSNFKTYITTGFVVNDLHRHWLAYYGVQIITHALNGSLLAKNDGPVSVLRAFKRKELIQLLNKAEIYTYSIHWRWAFRYVVVGQKSQI
jgi:2-polyprenyl-3-methyl-5-hydroxy-6-metoxy-1,4-benzoquinol methylase